MERRNERKDFETLSESKNHWSTVWNYLHTGQRKERIFPCLRQLLDYGSLIYILEILVQSLRQLLEFKNHRSTFWNCFCEFDSVDRRIEVRLIVEYEKLRSLEYRDKGYSYGTELNCKETKLGKKTLRGTYDSRSWRSNNAALLVFSRISTWGNIIWGEARDHWWALPRPIRREEPGRRPLNWEDLVWRVKITTST